MVLFLGVNLDNVSYCVTRVVTIATTKLSLILFHYRLMCICGEEVCET